MNQGIEMIGSPAIYYKKTLVNADIIPGVIFAKNINKGVIVTGRRHHKCVEALQSFGLKIRRQDIVDGFVTTQSRFVNREDGAMIAYQAGQICAPTDALYSEFLIPFAPEELNGFDLSAAIEAANR